MQKSSSVFRTRTMERREAYRATLRARRESRREVRHDESQSCSQPDETAATTTPGTSLPPRDMVAIPSASRRRIATLADAVVKSSSQANASSASSNLFDLAGKVSVVTGGTGVLGSVLCRGLAAHGARVAVLGRRAEVAQNLADEIVASGGQAMALVADVTDSGSLIEARARLQKEWGSRVDILVNAAGGNQSGATIDEEASFSQSFDMEAFDQVTDLNLVGIILPSKVFGEMMERQKSGAIVNISSMAASQAISRVCGYSAAKAATENFTKWLAVELAIKEGDKLRVNAIAPGFFVAEQNRELLINPDGSLTDRGNDILKNTPFRRFGEPDELVGPLVMLCSDAGSFVTGQVVNVDGGFSAYSGV